MKVTPTHDKILLEEIEDKKRKLWEKGKLHWKCHAAQKKIYGTLRQLPYTTRKRVVECARGFGKSYLGVLMAVEDCLREPHTYPVRIIGPELKQTVEIVTPLLERIASDSPRGLFKRLKAENKWRIGNNELILGGFNRDYIDRLRGQRAKSIYIEECRDVDSDNYKYGMADVLSPMVLHSLGTMTLMTTPPREEDHWFLEDTVPEAQLLGAYFRYTIYDNPLLTPEQIQIAFKESGNSEQSETWRREYLVEHFRSTELVAVPEFDESRHVREVTIPQHCHWQLSMDFGGVQDKTVALLYYFDFVRSRLCIIGERVFGSGTPTTEIVSGTLNLELEAGPPGTVKDRSIDAPGQILVDLNTLHKFSGRIPLKDEFEAQVNAMQVAFGKDQIEIHPKCQFLINTLRYGRLNKKRTDYSRTDSLGHCDALAALSYAWRSARKDNPFPHTPVNYQREWQNPAKRIEHDRMKKLAKLLVPRHIITKRVKKA